MAGWSRAYGYLIYAIVNKAEAKVEARISANDTTSSVKVLTEEQVMDLVQTHIEKQLLGATQRSATEALSPVPLDAEEDKLAERAGVRGALRAVSLSRQ